MHTPLDYRRTILWALGSLVAGLALSSSIAWHIHKLNFDDAENAAEQSAEQLRGAIYSRLKLYTYGLKSARGHVLALGQHNLSRSKFIEYMASRDIDSEFPGARGFGFIRRVRERDLANFIRAARADDWPDFKVRELGPYRGERFIIQYIEPVARNGVAVGLDIASEQNRRRAAVESMLSGEVRISGPITLVQATGNPLQSFLIMLPVYSGAITPEDRQARREDLFGWTYAPLLMQDVFAELPLDPDTHVVLRDVSDSDNPIQFFANTEHPKTHYLHVRHLDFDVYGRHWAMEYGVAPAFIGRLHHITPLFIFSIGAPISIVLACLAGVFNLNRQRKRMVQREQARSVALVESSIDAIIGLDTEGVVTSWNHGAELTYGYSADDAIGRQVNDLIVPENRRDEDRKFLERIARGESIYGFSTRRRKRDGSEISVSLSLAPIYDGSGDVIGAAKTARDISAQMELEEQRRELNVFLEREVEARTAELEKARHTLQTILDAMPSLIGYWDKQLVVRSANRAYHQWSGQSSGAVLGQNIHAIHNAKMLADFDDKIRAALRGEAQSFEYRMPFANDGCEHHTIVHLLPDVFEGSSEGIFVFIHDVNDLTESQQQLATAIRENNALIHTINEQMLFSVTDTKGRIIDVNARFCELSGYSREELIGQDHRILNSKYHPRDFWREMWGTVKSGRPWHGEICNVCKDGSLRWFDSVIAPFQDDDGNIERFVALRTDITERKRAEQERNSIHSLLSNVLSSASQVSIIATELDGTISIFNTGAERMLGYRADELIGKHSPEIIHSEDEIVARSQQLSAEYGKAIDGFDVFIHLPLLLGQETNKWTYVRRDGSTLKVSLSVTPIRDSNDNVTGFLGIAVDITEQFNLEKSLTEAKERADLANQAKSAFLANMSHEIRTPMNAVLGMLYLVQQTELHSRQRDYLTKADSAAKSLLGLLNDILDFSKIEAGKLTLDIHSFELDQLLQDLSIVVTGSTGQKPVELIFDIDPHLPMQIQGDRLRLQQILFNLASNAVKFTTEGHVLIRIKLVSANAQTATIQFCVEDTGIGISKEQQEKIFDGFVQAETSTARRFGGTGLGLAITRRLVTMMDGELQIDSKTGHGSRFQFELSFGIVDASSQIDRLDPLLSPLQILIVDNNALGGQVLRQTLASAGCNVDLVDHFDAAIPKIQAAIKRYQSYDCVILNSLQPDSDGLECAESLHRIFGSDAMPVVIMTSAREREKLATRIYASEIYNVELITKPLIPKHLFDTVLKAARFTSPISVHTRSNTSQSLAGMHLLVVEDNEINREVAYDILNSEGASVTLADGGLAGVDAVVNSGDTFDVVIMDMQMPDIDGLEATRRIRADNRFKDLPILAMTANASESDREICLAAGMNEHIGKPIDVVQLVDRLLALTQRPLAKSAEKPESMIANDDQLLEPVDSIVNRFGGRISTLQNTIANFKPSVDRLLQDLTQNLNDEKISAAAAIAHAIKGVAATLGAKLLAEQAATMEKALKKTGDIPPAERITIDQLIELSNTFKRSEDALRLALSRIDDPVKKTAKCEYSPGTPEWEQQLATLAKLLETNNLDALDIADELQACAPYNQIDEYTVLYNQIQALDFSAALSTLQSLRAS